jgi:hypothetical protein
MGFHTLSILLQNTGVDRSVLVLGLKLFNILLELVLVHVLQLVLAVCR